MPRSRAPTERLEFFPYRRIANCGFLADPPNDSKRRWVSRRDFGNVRRVFRLLVAMNMDSGSSPE
jgi:hypothetical protein